MILVLDRISFFFIPTIKYLEVKNKIYFIVDKIFKENFYIPKIKINNLLTIKNIFKSYRS